MKIFLRAVKQAADTWALIRQIPDYELVVGKALFGHIFALAPQAQYMYSFAIAYHGENEANPLINGRSPFDPVPEEIYELEGFRQHAVGVVTTLGTVLCMMMGDGISDLAKTLATLGARHVAYGVQAQHYQILETALLRALEDVLKQHVMKNASEDCDDESNQGWNETVRKGWAAVIKFITNGMQAGAVTQVKISADEEGEAKPSATLRLKVKQRKEVSNRVRRSRSSSSIRSSNTSSTASIDSSSSKPLCMPSWPDQTPAGCKKCKRRNSDSVVAPPQRFGMDAPPSMPRRNSEAQSSSAQSAPPLSPQESHDSHRNLDCSPILPRRYSDLPLLQP